MTGWDRKFMGLAIHVAGWSKERGRRVGAVIVGPDNEVRTTGFNGMPRGVDESVEERHSVETGAKYRWSSHAERNAIYNAARVGIPLASCKIYVPWFPCIECSKAIIQSGLSELVGFEPDFSDPKWGNDFQETAVMLEEGGVIVRFLNRIDFPPIPPGSFS